MNALRLALGTLTVLPVRPPTTVDRRTAGRAMVLAPLVGLLLGVVALAGVAALVALTTPHGFTSGGMDASGFVIEGQPEPDLYGPQGPTLLYAALFVGLLALLTRGMHLDGLADTADGLGSGRDRARALDVMRKSDVGPFGVATLVLALLVQVAAVDAVLRTPDGVLLLLGAVVLSRLALPVLCSTGIPSARPEGLGATVAGSVTRGALGVAVVLAALAVALAALLNALAVPFHVLTLPHAAAAVVVPLVATGLFALRCLRRFGGITGDVLGACVEVAFTAALVVAAL